MKRGNHFTSLLWHLFRVWKYIAYEFCLPVKLIGLNGRRDSHEIETLFGAAESSLHCVDRRDGRWENMWNKLLFPWFIENHLQPKKHTFISVPPSNQMTTRLAGKTNRTTRIFYSPEHWQWVTQCLKTTGKSLILEKSENYGEGEKSRRK